jgi:V/A-type H+-transporting ATPase subunit C
MQRRVAHYAYLHARVSAMAAQLLSRERLEALLEQPPGQEGEALQQAGLGVLRAEVPSLEQRMITLLLADFVILVRALSGAARDFMLYWAYRFELSNLKTIIRGKMAGQPEATIRAQLVDMGRFARLPVDALLGTEDIAELLRRLDGTPLADVARQARRTFEEQHELFPLDAAIDRRYYAGLSQRARRLGDPQLVQLIGEVIDRVNLVWLLRYRFAYDLSPAEAYYLLIPTGYRLTGRTLLTLSALNSFEDVIATLPAPFASWLADARNTSEVTAILERAELRLAAHILRYTAFNLGRAFAYLVLRERDLRQVRAILKGRRLRIPDELVRSAAGLASAAT